MMFRTITNREVQPSAKIWHGFAMTLMIIGI